MSVARFQITLAVVSLALFSLSSQIHARTTGPHPQIPANKLSAHRAGLFSYERDQLTSEELLRLHSSRETPGSSGIFSFDDGSDKTGRLIQSGECKAFPETSSWPSQSAWNELGNAIGSSLIPTTPLAAPCFKIWSVYNAEKCKAIQSSFSNPYTHEDDPTSTMWPLYQGRTCLPLVGGNATCTLGGSPSYAVNVSSVKHIQLAVNFARNTNLRLVVKNTGHCYLGKSTGAGALSVWTHNLKDIEYLPQYEDGSYAGPAMKLGAGVTVREVYDAAAHHNVTALGGICEV